MTFYSRENWPRPIDTDLDNLYDATTDEELSAVLSAAASLSLASASDYSPRLLVIPSPSAWPSIDKLKSKAETSPTKSTNVPPCIVLTPVERPSTPSSEPSLDDFSDDEGYIQSSCPPTPGCVDCFPSSDPDDSDYCCSSCVQSASPRLTPIHEPSPIRLRPDAIQTLNLIHSDHSAGPSPSIPSASTPGEMFEIHPAQSSNDNSKHFSRPSLIVPNTEDKEETLSVLSIPSPNGMFNSVADVKESPAEDFYAQYDHMEVAPDQQFETELPQGRKEAKFEQQQQQQQRQQEEEDPNEWYDETYATKLQAQSRANLDLTARWLGAQDAYEKAEVSDQSEITVLKPIVNSNKGRPRNKSDPCDGESVQSSPPSKSVRFAIANEERDADNEDDRLDCHEFPDDTFLRGFKHRMDRSDSSDVFVARQAREEALKISRQCMTSSHRDRLLGRLELAGPSFVAPIRPISNMATGASQNNTQSQSTAEEVIREGVAAAHRERQALDQVALATWALEGARFLNGGGLLPKEPLRAIRIAGLNAKVLDLGGSTTCDWAWQIALENPEAEVTTAYMNKPSSSTSYGSPIIGSPISATTITTNSTRKQVAIEDQPWVAGPVNHRRVPVSTLWNLPFPDQTFDVISARNLHNTLRRLPPRADISVSSSNGSSPIETTPSSATTIVPSMSLDAALAARQAGAVENQQPQPQQQQLGGDEIDRCLSECRRVLKKGGYIEFSVMDADLLNAGPLGQALAVEFAFNLKTRGYDASLSRSMLGRLRHAGFDNIRRAWIGLPMGDAASTSGTANVAPIASLVGSWAWERWMVKLAREMGRDEQTVVRDVASVLEEGKTHGGAWRLLNGWARKE